eukprot:374212-Prymnesium_polylepis.2
MGALWRTLARQVRRNIIRSQQVYRRCRTAAIDAAAAASAPTAQRRWRRARWAVEGCGAHATRHARQPVAQTRRGAPWT